MLSDASGIASKMWSKGSNSQETLAPSFMSLPLEMKIAIARSCEPADLAVLTRLSSEMRSITMPILYHSVDMSCHRDQGTFGSTLMAVESDNPMRLHRDERVGQVGQRQLAFIRAILAHPEYATHIKSLAWTFFNVVDQSDSGEVAPEGPLWKCLTAMKNVEILDFCSLAMWREVHTPLGLFPSTRKISLGGLMSFALATSILRSGNPALITSLELNNLQDLGQRRKGTGLVGNEDLSALDESVYPDQTPKFRLPGPMRDHLRTLTGKCTSLRHLALRSVGDDYIANPMWSAPLDELRYKQWAAFIDSVRGTLRTFEFEQGIPPQYHNQDGCFHREYQMPLQVIRPMDARYLKYIAPVLIHGSWPELNRVIIRGVGGSVQRYYVHTIREDDLGRIAKSQQRLQQALEPKVLLTFEQEATKSFYHIKNLNLIVPGAS